MITNTAVLKKFCHFYRGCAGNYFDRGNFLSMNSKLDYYIHYFIGENPNLIVYTCDINEMITNLLKTKENISNDL